MGNINLGQNENNNNNNNNNKNQNVKYSQNSTNPNQNTFNQDYNISNNPRNINEVYDTGNYMQPKNNKNQQTFMQTNYDINKPFIPQQENNNSKSKQNQKYEIKEYKKDDIEGLSNPELINLMQNNLYNYHKQNENKNTMLKNINNFIENKQSQINYKKIKNNCLYL